MLIWQASRKEPCCFNRRTSNTKFTIQKKNDYLSFIGRNPARAFHVTLLPYQDTSNPKNSIRQRQVLREKRGQEDSHFSFWDGRL
uniref:Ovule protein n=1 Tax=Caenorhabditis tropicalis TaxID=1561998 RepID=A0A1I7TM43_9PELO